MLVPPPDFINVVFTDKMPNLKMSLHICSLFVIELKMCVIKIKPPMFQYFCKICFISNVIFQVVYHTRCNKLHRSLTCRHARRKRYCNASAASLELGGGGKDLLKGTSTVAGKQTNMQLGHFEKNVCLSQDSNVPSFPQPKSIQMSYCCPFDVARNAFSLQRKY